MKGGVPMAVESSTAPPTRRLTAVLLADVVGYSRMMSDDEDTGTRPFDGLRP